MTRDAAMMWGITLLLVPTIAYGGLTLLGVLTKGAFGAPAPQTLSPQQVSLYRAGHAHAGVLAILSLAIQLALDHALLSPAFIWPLRVAALAVPLLVSAGFFGMAHLARLRSLLYAGAFLLVLVTLSVGIGLIRFASHTG